MPRLVKIIDGESGLEGEVTKTHKIVSLSKPTLHVEVVHTPWDGLRREKELQTKAEKDRETYYLFRYAFGYEVRAIAYNTFKRRETS